MSNAIYPAGVRGLAISITKRPEWYTIVQRAVNAYETRIAQTGNPIWHWSLIYNYLKDSPNDIATGLTYTDLKTLEGFFLSRNGQFDDFLFDDVDDDDAPSDSTWKPGVYYFAGNKTIDPGGFKQQVTIPGFSGNSAPSWNSSGGITVDGGASWLNMGLWPGSAAQTLQLVNDGAGTYYSPIQRNFGGFLEDVTDLNTAVNPLRVWANGTLQTGGICASGGPNYELHGPGLAIPGYSFVGMYLKWCAQPTGPITAAFNFHFRVRFEMDSVDFERFLYDLSSVGGDNASRGSGEMKLMTSRPPAA